MDPEVLVNRARERCSHRPMISGFCSTCFQWAMAEMLAEANAELCMDDAINVVSEWMLSAGRMCTESWGSAR